MANSMDQTQAPFATLHKVIGIISIIFFLAILMFSYLLVPAIVVKFGWM